MPEVLGDAASFFDPHRVDDMAETIAGLLADKNKRQDLSDRASLRAKTYSWESTMRRTVDVILAPARS